MACFRCPSCTALLNIADSLRGQLCRCGVCNREMRVPLSIDLPAIRQELDTAIQSARPGINAGPRMASPPVEAPALDRAEYALLPAEAPAAPLAPVETKVRRRKKGAKNRSTRPESGRLAYYLGAIRPFGWMLVGLFVLWLGNVVFALLNPGLSGQMMLTGNVLMLFGNVWIAFIAFRENHTYGMLCFFTCLFTYVYIFMNLEETWKPASLTALGFLFMGAALVVP